MMRGRVASLVSVTLLTGCTSMFGLSRSKVHTVDDLASFALPSGWSGVAEVVREPDYALFEFRRSQTWWMGAGDPLEADAWVVIARADADEAVLQAAIDDAYRRVRPKTQEFPGFDSLKDGPRETWIHEGNYQISSLHKPERVTFLRAVDRERNVAFVTRVYTRKTPHKSLQKITRSFFSTLVVTESRTNYFREIGHWSDVRAGRVQREIGYINTFLTERGLPAAGVGETVLHEGWVYTLTDNRFIIGRLLGSRRLANFPYGARGELSWLRHTGTAWTSSRASNAARPPRGEPYFFSADALPAWADAITPAPDTSLAWFFTARNCELTGDEWEPPRDPAAWDLSAWWDNTLRIQAAFSANALFIE